MPFRDLGFNYVTLSYMFASPGEVSLLQYVKYLIFLMQRYE